LADSSFESDLTAMAPDQYCQQKAAASGSSFYYSFLFLPPERRRAITALYAFCREVDDVVDETSDPHIAATKLAWWRAEVGHLYAGNPRHPVTRALAPCKDVFSISSSHLNEIIDGMEMDLTQTRYLDWQGLERYCYRVAGVVGLLAAGIFGYRDPRTLEYAKNLGLAFQLTNIIRDVGEDARKNRIYLPMDDMKKFGVPASDILNGNETESFRNLAAFQANRARIYYERAFASLPAADRRAQRPGLIMAAIYQALLREIERDGFHVLKRKTSLTPLRKFWIAWKTWVAG
jgi:15-cis-phytoene synthase